jgi:DNA repair exonuclease SbcCD nuclease subunit
VKLAHLADVHLGFRQYHRMTALGINQREADVAHAFRRAVDDVIAAVPDVVIIAGDLFHSVRPSNPAIVHSFGQLRRLREALPAVPVVIVAGNHDAPRSLETGTILRLFEAVEGVHVVTDGVTDLELEELGLTLTCVPHASWIAGARPTLAPPPGPGRKVLVTHGEVAGVLRREASALEHGGAVFETGELSPERWDYIALGHYHVAHRVAENAWYCGALDYVSSNPWGELLDEARERRPGAKGWLLVELGDALRVEFRPVPLARRIVDLPAIDAAGLGADAVNERIRENVASLRGGIAEQIVRQVVTGIPRPIARELDYTTVREYKSTALHYQLDLRRPQDRHEVGVGAPGVRQTLVDLVADYLARRPLDAEVDHGELVALGRRYMDDVERDLREA